MSAILTARRAGSGNIGLLSPAGEPPSTRRNIPHPPHRHPRRAGPRQHDEGVQQRRLQPVRAGDRGRDPIRGQQPLPKAFLPGPEPRITEQPRWSLRIIPKQKDQPRECPPRPRSDTPVAAGAVRGRTPVVVEPSGEPHQQGRVLSEASGIVVILARLRSSQLRSATRFPRSGPGSWSPWTRPPPHPSC